MIAEAEQRFPGRIKVAIRDGGLGRRVTEMQNWLDGNCGSDGWARTPAGLRRRLEGELRGVRERLVHGGGVGGAPGAQQQARAA